MNVKERNIILDIMKGIGALLVILGHAIQRTDANYYKNAIFIIIYSFHMPLFFFLSGFVVNKSKLDKRYIVKKFNRLIVPFFLWYIIYYFFSKFKFTGLKPYLDYSGGFISYIIRGIVYPNNGLWFLWSLFYIYIIYYICKKLSKNDNKSFCIYIVIILVILRISGSNKFGINTISYYLVYFFIGYIYSKYKYVNKNEKTLIMALCICIAIEITSYVLIKYFGCNHYSGLSLILKFFNTVIKYILAIQGIILTYVFSKQLIKKSNKVTAGLTYVGKVSLELYVCQCLVLNIGIGNGIIRTLTVFFNALVISIILIHIIKKYKITSVILFGYYNK